MGAYPPVSRKKRALGQDHWCGGWRAKGTCALGPQGKRPSGSGNLDFSGEVWCRLGGIKKPYLLFGLSQEFQRQQPCWLRPLGLTALVRQVGLEIAGGERDHRGGAEWAPRWDPGVAH